MATKENQESSENCHQLPLVLLHRPTVTPLIPSLKHRLESHFRLLDPSDCPEPIQFFLSRHGHSARAVLCFGYAPLRAETLRLLPSLELVVATSAGVDFIDLPECRRRGITITNASAAFAEDGADYAVALLIGVLRRVSAADRYVRAGLWPQKGEYPLGFKLGGKRVGILGFGSIGSKIANRLAAFGCSIAYNSRKKKPSVPFTYYPNVSELAASSDILIASCSLTEETHHIINKDVMKALGKEGIIINVGRGALVDEKELVQALIGGEIGGAGLDVFEKEPNVPKELYELDNVVLSPHRAIFSLESFAALEELIVGNLRAFFSNNPLLSVVQNE